MQVSVDITVPDPQHLPTSRRQVFFTDVIMSPLGVAAMGFAIHLHDKLGCNACEIHNVRTHRVLPPEFRVKMATQTRPENNLCTGHSSAQLLCKSP